MRIIVFAGGVGSRLWPLSRKNSPKQFGKIIGEKSTLQEAISRLQPTFKPADIYIATGKRYKDIVLEQLPEIPKENFIFEPEMRDVGPAIGLATTLLGKKDPDEPIAIIWSDHLVKHVKRFQHILSVSENAVKEKKADFVFIAQKPRFANQNIGWIQCGEEVSEEDGLKMFRFKKLKYRPKLSQAEDFFEDKHYVWNLGYFVTTPRFLSDKFQSFVPDMFDKLSQIGNAAQTDAYEQTLDEIYPTLEKITFDDAILEKISPNNIFVISEDIGWSDIGAWEALKEALAAHDEENVTQGNVLVEDSVDSLIFNYTDQLVVGIDLADMVVVNTNDVVLICPKKSVPKIKKIVENLEGTSHEHLA
ncbi:MAG TPA: sugar phosphate nucleotidyltransferase [Candidatus Saccharimonadales bacterium]|nr:sugar phosphate nucleotidyltransferase [Candidatus Saccharimonadales bacterium]